MLLNWQSNSPADILADINALLKATWSAAQPDTIIVPYWYIYPAPVRFRVTGKRGKGAIERERLRQTRGYPVRVGVLSKERGRI